MTPQLLEEKIEEITTKVYPYVIQDLVRRNLEGEIEALVEEVQREALNTDKVTRVEVIDHTKDFEEGGGRAYVNWKDTNKVELSFQDEGRTLKVFISNQQDKQE